jgi:hypothetical protein
MRKDLKAWLAIFPTFALGIVVGLLLNGTMNQRRQGEMQRMRRPGGFVAEMEQLIRPRDSAQREQIRPLLIAADNRNRAIVDGARGSMRSAMDSLIVNLAPVLDNEQEERLMDFAHRGPRRPPPGLGGEGPPPPGMPPPR